jgi:hypothetical protein
LPPALRLLPLAVRLKGRQALQKTMTLGIKDRDRLH